MTRRCFVCVCVWFVCYLFSFELGRSNRGLSFCPVISSLPRFGGCFLSIGHQYSFSVVWKASHTHTKKKPKILWVRGRKEKKKQVLFFFCYKNEWFQKLKQYIYSKKRRESWAGLNFFFVFNTQFRRVSFVENETGWGICRSLLLRHTLLASVTLYVYRLPIFFFLSWKNKRERNEQD